jgi:glutamate-5-semialdehyde dehydrogenase
MDKFLQAAKTSAHILSTLSSNIKNDVLHQIADALEENSADIIIKNQLDMNDAVRNNLSDALIDRLFLDNNRIHSMANAIRDIAALKNPVGRIHEGWTTDTSLNIQKVSVPIGVIGIIYESRPNVTSDTAALCFKSGNVCILKGGKEAQHSNEIIANILQEVLVKNNLPKEMISLIPDNSREAVATLIKKDEYVDLIIPRGGEALIKYITSNASVPVVKHDKGLCHTYIHQDANIKKAIDISINAKCRRTGICGAMETLLIDENIATKILPLLQKEFDIHKTILKGCEQTIKIIDIQSANEDDWNTEYLDNILSIKIVKNINEAIFHIEHYGSQHSDAIITENHTIAEQFLNQINSACVYLNASTQFTDGGQFGFGAEVGISTNKLHARGPMGLNELTTYKFKVLGNGECRA